MAFTLSCLAAPLFSVADELPKISRSVAGSSKLRKDLSGTFRFLYWPCRILNAVVRDRKGQRTLRYANGDFPV